MSSKITPQAQAQARHRRQRESLQEQLIANTAEIKALLEQNRKIGIAIHLHDECDVHGIVVGDHGDIDFALGADDGR